MPEPIELQDFLLWEPPKLVPVISNGLMYAGSRVILYGRYKSLKSMLATRFGIAVSRGEEWIGFATTQSDTLYLQLEIPNPMLHNRMSKMMQNLNGTGHGSLWLWTESAMKLDTDKGQQQIKYYLEKYHPKVLIIDPIYKIVSGGIGETDPATKLVDIVDELVDKYQLSVMLVHHTRKGETPQEYGNADDMLGSSIYLDWADTIIRVERTAEKDIEVSFDVVRHADSELTKRHFELDPRTLGFISSSGRKI